MKKIINEWDKFWKLTVINETLWKNNKRRFILKCDCWNICEVWIWNFTSWHTKSCWCINKFSLKNLNRKLSAVFRSMLFRCNNEKSHSYKNYGWRGIKCEWTSFEEFYRDMWDSYIEWLTIDRKDNDWNYCKDNCRWATKMEQCRNKRNNLLFNWEPLAKVCEDRWLVYKRVHWRIRHWKSIEESLF